jgi:hypothetical protein
MDVIKYHLDAHYRVHASARLDSLESTHIVGRDPERALREIEAQNSISLSRTLSTPNIASKGALEQRAVSIPAALFPPGHHYPPSRDKPPPKKLIEEVSTIETPSWTWSQEGGEIHITVKVANLVRHLRPSVFDLFPVLIHSPDPCDCLICDP